MAALTVKDASHSSHLKEEFVSMREAGELFDYEIKGSNESFSIHSLVLASMSGMFKVMLKSNMAESAKREAEFPTIPDGILRKIIDFAYTGTCTFARDELKPLITAAHYLQMAKLQRVCEEKISAVPQPSDCFSWLQTDEFLGAEMTEIAQYLMSSLRKKGIDSDTLVEAVLRWIKHDSPKRSVHMIELFACVSLGKCTKPFLSKVVKKNSELLASQHNVYKLMLTEILSEDSAKPCEKLLILGGMSESHIPNHECWILNDNGRVKFADGPANQLFPGRSIYTVPPDMLRTVEPDSQLQPFHSVCQVPHGVMLTGGDVSKMCMLFDVTDKTWLDRGNLLSRRSCHGSGYLSGKVYVIGGDVHRYCEGNSCTVDYMDLNTNTWQHGPAIPETELYPKVAVCNSMLYVLLTDKGRLYCLDGEGMSWPKKSNIPASGGQCSMAAVDDKIFAAGGINKINCVYTPTSNTWCCLTGPSLRVRHASLVYYRQKLLLIGGHNWESEKRDMQVYDIRSDTWSL